MFRVNMAFATSYSETVYRGIVHSLGSLCSLAPFSIFEILVYIGILALLFNIGRLIYLIIRYHKKGNIFNFTYRLKRFGLGLACILLALLNVYTLTCGCNNCRLPFSAANAYYTKERSSDELIALGKLLIAKANEVSEEIPVDDEGYFTLENIDINESSVNTMNNLTLLYPCMSDYYPNPKKILLSNLMSYTQITGIYSPFTVEANYNGAVPDTEIPYTVCHELSHLAGFMLEDEANFISYLACINSHYVEFKYSGLINVIIQTNNQIFSTCGVDSWREVWSGASEQLIKDMDHQSAYWSNLERDAGKVGEVVSNVSNTVNDTYIKSTGQEDGVKSYGKVVDLLLTYYEKEL